MTFNVSNSDSIEGYLKSLQDLRDASLVSYESVLRRIQAQETVLEHIQKNSNLQYWECLEALCEENIKLKEKETMDYVQQLEDENKQLRSLLDLSPITRVRPPLPKPTQYSFWNKSRDIPAMEAEMKRQSAAAKNLENLSSSCDMPTKAKRYINQAAASLRACHRDNDNMIEEYYAYQRGVNSLKRARCGDTDEEEEEGSVKKRHRHEV